jgi:hypothetical protein
MKKSKFTEEQIVGILRETDRDPVATVAKAPRGERAGDLHVEEVPLRRGPPCFVGRVGRGQHLWLSLSAEL